MFPYKGRVVLAAKLGGINKKNYHTLWILTGWGMGGWAESIKKEKLMSKIIFLIMVDEVLC